MIKAAKRKNMSSFIDVIMENHDSNIFSRFDPNIMEIQIVVINGSSYE